MGCVIAGVVTEIAVENDAEASERLFTAVILLRDLASERPAGDSRCWEMFFSGFS